MLARKLSNLRNNNIKKKPNIQGTMPMIRGTVIAIIKGKSNTAAKVGQASTCNLDESGRQKLKQTKKKEVNKFL